MKTLAEFKRTITPGLHVQYVKNEERKYSEEHMRHVGEFFDNTEYIPERIRGVRYVSYVDTTGFYLKQPEDKSKRGSFCGWPKAAELEFDGDTFTITDLHRGEPYQRRHYQIVRYS